MMRHLIQMVAKGKRKYLGAGLLLTAILLFALASGCALNGLHKGVQDLTQNIPKEEVETVDMMEPSYESVNPREELTEFSLELLSENLSHGNYLISPFPIVPTLRVTASGTEDSMRVQMEQVTYTDTAALDNYLKACIDHMSNSKACQVNVASSIWSKDRDSLAINEDSLKTSRNYYDASILKAPFDAGTRDDVNSWTKRGVDGMIQKLLEEAPPRDVITYLVNMLSFDREWRDIYKKNQIHERTSNAENREHQSAELMYSTETVYLKNTLRRGSLKLYGDGAYAFAAVLPDEGMTMKEFLERLKENGTTDLFEQTRNKAVCARLSKSTVKHNVVLNESLAESGIKDVFDSQKTDFPPMAHSDNDNIYISKMTHKIKIDMDERRTEVEVMTAAEVSEGSVVQAEKLKEVFPDKLFFYMITDTRQNSSLFMGRLMQLE